MQLSDYDLKQLNEGYVGSLAESRLRALSLKLLADLKEARDRLNQNPGNSSRPPSSRAPWEKATSDDPYNSDNPNPDSEEPEQEEDNAAEEPPQSPESDETEETESKETEQKDAPSTKGKPGKQVGAPGFGRKLGQDLAISAEYFYRPEFCGACGDCLSSDAPAHAYTARLEVEIGTISTGVSGLEVTQTKHTYEVCQCGCGHWTRAEPGRCEPEDGWKVELTEWHVAGPMLVTFIGFLAMRMRLSRARIREFLSDWLGLPMSIGTINQCVHEAGRALEPVVKDEILSAVREAELLHADETSWKESGQPLWLWVFSCASVTLFMIGRRTAEMVSNVLGDSFNGWLMSDGYLVYRNYDWRLRCLAHLVRKARGLAESLDSEAQAFGKHALLQLEVLMEAVYQAREGPPGIPLTQIHAECLEMFRSFCEQYWDAEHKKTRELAREFLFDWDAIWAVLDYPWLPLTNNEAEQALRHWVISRRISFGTRTPEGSRAFTSLASVIETCRKRNVLPWPYIAEVIRQRRKGKPVPPLPQTVVA
jgi:transposase